MNTFTKNLFLWITIILVVLLLFGGRKIPELMKGLGSGLKEFKKASKDEITEDEIQENEDQTKEEELIEFETPQKVNLDNELNVSNDQSMRIEAREREERLREISIKLRTPSGLTKLEEEPAYKRNNVDLEETVHSSEDEVSSFTLEEKDDDIILNDNNSYLHDNVD